MSMSVEEICGSLGWPRGVMGRGWYVADSLQIGLWDVPVRPVHPCGRSAGPILDSPGSDPACSGRWNGRWFLGWHDGGVWKGEVPGCDGTLPV